MAKKRSQIVPPPIKDKKPKKPRASKDAEHDATPQTSKPPAQVIEQMPQHDADSTSLLSLHLDSPPPQTGGEILQMPNRQETPARFFAWMIAPLSPSAFEKDVRERRPLYIDRSAHRTFYRDFFSIREFERILRSEQLKWTKDIDITKYECGERRTLNEDGEIADADRVLKSVFTNGCSARLSWPQKHSDQIWSLVSTIEEYFACGGGCNVYLTPPDAQGFAPHYDDVDVFVLQIEGEKRWVLHSPLDESDILPRFPSQDLHPEALGEPLATVTMHPGDIMYLPRGTIHHAISGSGAASLHLTVSISRLHTWRDLLEVAFRGALETASANDPTFRRAPPRGHLEYMGIIHSDEADQVGEQDSEPDSRAQRRAAFSREASRLMTQVLNSVPLDDAVDQFAAHGFLHDRLAPFSAPMDVECLLRHDQVSLDSRIRLRSRRVARLTIEGEVAVLYHCGGNGREMFHAHSEPQHIDFAIESAPALEAILCSFPKYTSVCKLPAENDAQRLDLVRALAEESLLITKQ